MRIALVNQPCPVRTPSVIPARGQPLGLAYVAASARQDGHTPMIVDANAPADGCLSVEQVCKSVLDYQASVVGISAKCEFFNRAVEISQKIKSACPSIKIVFGGHHVTMLSREIIGAYPSIDVIVRGEGEKVFCDLLRTFETGENLAQVPGITCRIGNAVESTLMPPPIGNLDSIPFPARDLLPPLHQYSTVLVDGARKVQATVATSRGCTHRCSFCSIQTFYGVVGRRLRKRSIESVVEEIL